MATTSDDYAKQQADLWNGPFGEVWVEIAAVLDQMFAPIADLLAAAAAPGDRVLDVGCGTGATTLAIARRLGEGGACLGVDLSAPMIELARSRAGSSPAAPRFLVADAAAHRFEPGSFDLLASRFGVMFFADPGAAFANLHRAAADDARLRFVAWRAPEENAFMTRAVQTAAPFLPEVAAKPPPEAPGQFAFADPSRVRRILSDGGWSEPEIEPIEIACDFPASGLLPYLTRLGPVGRALRDVDDRTREEVVDALRPAFAEFLDGDRAHFTAACWTVGARA